MNAPFNQLSLVQRLEREGIARGAAEAIAGGIEDARSDLVTNATFRAELEVLRAEFKAGFEILRAEFDVLRSEFAGLRSELAGLRNEFAGLRNDVAGLREEMRLNMEVVQNRLVIRLGAISLGLISLMTAVLGTIIALK